MNPIFIYSMERFYHNQAKFCRAWYRYGQCDLLSVQTHAASRLAVIVPSKPQFYLVHTLVEP